MDWFTHTYTRTQREGEREREQGRVGRRSIVMGSRSNPSVRTREIRGMLEDELRRSVLRENSVGHTDRRQQQQETIAL